MFAPRATMGQFLCFGRLPVEMPNVKQWEKEQPVPLHGEFLEAGFYPIELGEPMQSLT